MRRLLWTLALVLPLAGCPKEDKQVEMDKNVEAVCVGQLRKQGEEAVGSASVEKKSDGTYTAVGECKGRGGRGRWVCSAKHVEKDVFDVSVRVEPLDRRE